MFLKSLTIKYGDGFIVRDIRFHTGLNLIVDETPTLNGKETGNNVGKTTVLKLIDFCLGAKAKGIYSDNENKSHEYKLVKEYLINKKIIISIVLTDDLSSQLSREILIERNFLVRADKIQRIEGINKTDEEYEETLVSLLFPGHYGKKPTFRQIIAHNIRYKDLSVNNTLKNLDSFTRDDEYETLYLFLFGCEFEQGSLKQELRVQIDIEEKFKKRLESEQTKSAYETALALLQSEIDEIERRKMSLNLNPNFELDLDKLNLVKYKLNVTSSEIGRLELRKALILEAQTEMQSCVSTIDLEQLKQIYQQATSLTNGIQKTFQELHNFHNRMIQTKVQYIVKDLPVIENELSSKRSYLNHLLNEERNLSDLITCCDSFEVLEQLIKELNHKYYTKGEYENTLHQLKTVESKLTELNGKLASIDNALFSDDYLAGIKEQVNKFNRHFSSVSNELYGEKYAIKVDTKTVKGRSLYEFTSFNTNFSSGKKIGEISCFDIAYTLFADEENIPCNALSPI